VPNPFLPKSSGPQTIFLLGGQFTQGSLWRSQSVQEEESEYETESEDEAYAGRRLLKPVFVPKESREVRVTAQTRLCRSAVHVISPGMPVHVQRSTRA